MMQVVQSALKPSDRVAELSETEVAVHTQQPADAPGAMTMINDKVCAPPSRRGCPAYATRTTLLFEHSIIVLLRYSIVPFQVCLALHFCKAAALLELFTRALRVFALFSRKSRITFLAAVVVVVRCFSRSTHVFCALTCARFSACGGVFVRHRHHEYHEPGALFMAPPKFRSA